MAAFLTASLVFALVSSFSVSADQKIITAEPGENVNLTCRTADNKDVKVVQWNRTDLKSDQYVLLYRNKKFDTKNQSLSFRNRVDLLDVENGDVSLVLKNVTTDDTGTYECRVVQRGKRVKIKDTDLISIINLKVEPAKQCEGAGKKDVNTSRKRRSFQDTDSNCNPNLSVKPGIKEGQKAVGGIKDGGMKTGLAASHVGLLWFFLLLLL